jgi:hypothetical protein
MYNAVEKVSEKYKLDCTHLVSHYFSVVPPKNVDDLISKIASEYNLDHADLVDLCKTPEVERTYGENLYYMNN